MKGRESVFDSIGNSAHDGVMGKKTVQIISAATIALVSIGGLSGCTTTGSPATKGASTEGASAAVAARSLVALEKGHQSRLGIMAIDLSDNKTVAYRSGERFAFASTNKTFIAAAILSHSTVKDLDSVVHFTAADLLAYAPITSRFVSTGMSVRELLDAMLRFSDNTAANLLVERLGGPHAIQEYLRALGDKTTDVDRLEPDLNTAIPGDVKDTTTPAQFAKDLRTVLLGTALDPARREILRNAMLDNTTGDGTIRAGVSAAWPVADKTGTGDRGVRNDIAVIYPTRRDPIVLIVMTAPADPKASADDALVASATKQAILLLGE